MRRMITASGLCGWCMMTLTEEWVSPVFPHPHDAGVLEGVGHWATDYPTADINLNEAISRTTNIPLMGEPLALSFRDPKIFEYPVLYLTEPGYWLTNDEEVANMRKYFAAAGS